MMHTVNIPCFRNRMKLTGTYFFKLCVSRLVSPCSVLSKNLEKLSKLRQF